MCALVTGVQTCALPIFFSRYFGTVQVGAGTAFVTGYYEPEIAASRDKRPGRSEEHTSELQSLMRNSYAVFCLKKKKNKLQSTISKNSGIHSHYSMSNDRICTPRQ